MSQIHSKRLHEAMKLAQKEAKLMRLNKEWRQPAPAAQELESESDSSLDMPVAATVVDSHSPQASKTFFQPATPPVRPTTRTRSPRPRYSPIVITGHVKSLDESTLKTLKHSQKPQKQEFQVPLKEESRISKSGLKMKEKLSDLERMRQDTDVRLQKAYDMLNRNSAKQALISEAKRKARVDSLLKGRNTIRGVPGRAISAGGNSAGGTFRSGTAKTAVKNGDKSPQTRPKLARSARVLKESNSQQKQTPKRGVAAVPKKKESPGTRTSPTPRQPSPVRPAAKTPAARPQSPKKQISPKEKSIVMKDIMDQIMHMFNSKFEPLIANAQDRLEQATEMMQSHLKSKPDIDQVHIVNAGKMSDQETGYKIQVDEPILRKKQQEKHLDTVTIENFKSPSLENASPQRFSPKKQVALVLPVRLTDKIESERHRRFQHMRMFVGHDIAEPQALDDPHMDGPWEALDRHNS